MLPNQPVLLRLDIYENALSVSRPNTFNPGVPRNMIWRHPLFIAGRWCRLWFLSKILLSHSQTLSGYGPSNPYRSTQVFDAKSSLYKHLHDIP